MQSFEQGNASMSGGERTPEQVRADVERTQDDLQRNVRELNDKVNPSRIASRQKEQAQQSLRGMRERVMGVPQSVASTSGGVGTTVRETTQGNPLAAGAVALGVGWIIGGLIPVSQAEKNKAAQLEAQVKQQAQPLMDRAAEQAQPAMDKVNEAVAPR